MKRNKKVWTVIMLGFCMVSTGSFAQRKTMARLIRDNFALANRQYHDLMKNIPANKMPQTFDHATGKVICYDIDWWCSGFYAGSLWYIYEQTHDQVLKKEAERVLKIIQTNETDTGTHDLGFMMYCSFGNAYRLTGDPDYKRILLRSAKSLATRFRPGIPAIQSWNKSKNFNCPVIIDNMMNLELLNWAGVAGNDTGYRMIAAAHANTTLKNHFRPDHSSFHVVDYNALTGAVLQKRTYQGYADGSAWARGQAWALYGFTVMYRFTRDPVYLKQALAISEFILGHPNLPADRIPYWDFNAPDIPNSVRDASAAAIMSSALLELGQYTQGEEKRRYVTNAALMLRSLSGPAYRALPGSCGGFLLKHSTGAYPLGKEIDVPLIYADYYFLEALMRYRKWYM